ncbi:MAG: YhdP family protein [Gammaproteobacteria bacterium]
MNAPNPAPDADTLARAAPSRSLKTFSALTRLLLWLVVAVWALFMLTWGALHGWIVPRISDWRPELERWATAQLGVSVKVGDIRADHGPAPGWLPVPVWGLTPTLSLIDVRLHDPGGREALHLPLVQASLSPASVWRLGFEQLLIDSPVLDVRRTPEGCIEVAGLDMASGPEADGSVADWFFRQSEFTIRQGTVRWTDDLKGQPPLALSQLDLVVRNRLSRHEFRVDATPPMEWGERLSLRGQLREPLIQLRSPGPGQMPWHDWSGEVFADFPHVDVSRLRAYVDLSRWDVQVRSGRGVLRAWADVGNGQVHGVTAQMDLEAVEATLGKDLPALALDTVTGRLELQWGGDGFEFATDDLRFQTREGDAWPGGQLRVRHRTSLAGNLAGTQLSADSVDLAALATLAGRLPLSAEVRGHLADLQPSGRVQGLSASWRPADEKRPLSYQARGKVVGLSLAGKPSGQRSGYGDYPVPGRPGIRNADIDFDLSDSGGQARIAVREGALELPDVFEDPLLALDRFDGRARWSVAGERIEVTLSEVRLANADAEGSATARWSTADPARSTARSRFPGELDLTATLTRADATRVHRYLPLSVSPDVRRYLREAARAGSSPRVDFRIRGDLWDLPFDRASGSQGEFRITAQLKAVDFDYVPAFLQSAGEAPWPALKGMDGQFVFDRDSIRITGLQGGARPLPGLRLSQGSFVIENLLRQPAMDISARVQGPANEMLAIVRDSPLNAMTSQALGQSRATGNASGQFALRIPFEDMGRTTVKGSVRLAGNDVRITPAAPLLANTSGEVSFSERGFEVAAARARAYGGDLSFDGGMQTDAQGQARIRFRGQGTATAEGLRQGELGLVSQLFANASGSAAYAAQLNFRAGVPEISVTSNLQGMAISLPAPLGKSADTVLPVLVEQAVQGLRSGPQGDTALTDRLNVDIGPPAARAVSLHYERDITGTDPRVLRGRISVGTSPDEAMPTPASGVQANLRFDDLDVGAWTRALPGQAGAQGQGGTADAMQYLPTMLAVRAVRVVQDGRTFQDVVVGGTRVDDQWRVNVSAREFDGYVEYRQPSDSSAGSIYARLSRLALSQAATTDVEEILQQPSSVPALDIAVQDLTLSGRSLGRVEVQAVNRVGADRVREWHLSRLHVAVPEARLNATGRWAPASGGRQRRATLAFRLDIRDAGKLLARFGRDGVVRGGEGTIDGDIGWTGSPFRLDYPSLSGQMKADIERGQFLQVEPGAAKLLGVLSLQSLPRRLVLDFRDVFSEGFAFDFIRGDASLAQGVMSTSSLQMKGVNAAVLMEGNADIGRETQDLKVVVVPEINAGTASLLATAINPAVGLGTFLAQLLLRQPLQSATTQQFHITGGWDDPKVEKIGRQPPVAPPREAPAVPR